MKIFRNNRVEKVPVIKNKALTSSINNMEELSEVLIDRLYERLKQYRSKHRESLRSLNLNDIDDCANLFNQYNKILIIEDMCRLIYESRITFANKASYVGIRFNRRYSFRFELSFKKNRKTSPVISISKSAILNDER